MTGAVPSPALKLYGLFALVTACALVLVAMPRAIAPSEMPALELSAAAVARVTREDAERAASAPNSAAAQELMARFWSFGSSEAAALEDFNLATQRKRALHRLYDRVVAVDGATAALKLREQALVKFEAALDGSLSKTESDAVMGLFANVLIEHQVTRDGEELAPHFVLRTLYKARWNRMLDLAPDLGFAQVERFAYFGWLGLHADNLPLAMRRQALQKYAAAGGPNAAEAQGVLAFLAQDYAESVRSLERAYGEAPSLRVRNYLRGARVAAGMAGQPEAAKAATGSVARTTDP
jgi:hypothetical protein